jgi:hypothetical protein
VLGLHEEDGSRFGTRDRELYTPGFPVYRDPAKAQFDFELESILQFGESRASAATDVVDLDHFAHMQHIQAGYTFDAPWSPRVLAQYDYASGDEDPCTQCPGHRRFQLFLCGNDAAVLITRVHKLILRARTNAWLKLSAPGERRLMYCSR